MSSLNFLWQVLNIIGLVLVVGLVFIFAKMIKNYAQKQGRKFWSKR